MDTKIGFALCALALAVPGLRAEPVAAPKTGRVVVLENDRILEGDIERVGDQYRIRRAVGETWVPGIKVRALCANLEEAYTYLRSQANLDDADERLRLARWCHVHELRAHALEEAAEAVRLRPDHAESQWLLRGLQRSDPAAKALVAKDEKAPEGGPAPDVEVNADSLGLFVKRVQPILMNACASCHGGDKGGTFKLMRSYEDSLINRRATQYNLAAVLAQVNRERPQASQLLTRAVSIHGKPGGMENPPIKNRQTPAYRSLEEWVQLAMAGAQTPVTTLVNVPAETKPIPEALSTRSTEAGERGASAPRATTKESQKSPVPAPPEARPEPVPQASVRNPAPPPAAPAAVPPAPPAKLEEPVKPALTPARTRPVDPFDPMIFNERWHPDRR